MEKPQWISYVCVHIFFNLIYLFLERGEGREKERKTSMCGCISWTPYWGPGPQPRHVSWLGIEPVTFLFTGQHSIHRATLARAMCSFFQLSFLVFFSITIYFPYTPSPLQSSHCCPCPWVFCFCLIPPRISCSPWLSPCSPSMSLSLVSLLVQFVH